MGNCCCRNESPCGSAEERSVLLKDDSKTAVTSGETTVVGTCGPGGDVDLRKTADEDCVKVVSKAEAEVLEKELNNTQENGPMQKEPAKTATTSPRKGSELKENSTRPQDEDIKEHPADDGKPEIQQCTLNSPKTEHTTADCKASPATNSAQDEEENPASAEDKVPDSKSVTAEAACSENHTETNTTQHIILDTPPDDDEETGSKVTIDDAAAEPLGEISQNNEVLSVPNAQLSAAESQETPVPAAAQEVDKESQKESLRRAVTEDSEASPACREDDPEVLSKSHDASEASPGPEPRELNHSEERLSANSAWESETTAPVDSSESSKCDQDAAQALDSVSPSSKEFTTLESVRQEEETTLNEQDKDGEDAEVKEEDKMKEKVEVQAVKDAEDEEVTEKKEQLTASTFTEVKTEETMRPEEEDSPVNSLGNSEEDLYRGAEELPTSQTSKPSVLESTLLKVEDRCSLAPAVDILSYSEREWKGNTAKSALIRKGYKEMSQRFGCLRRVRGDNYCALRATLFQVLSHSTKLPLWLQEEDITMLPKQLEAQEGLISQWTFPGECLQGDGTGDAIAQLKGYMELLRTKWQAAVDCSSASERQQLCERVFQGGEEELGLLEALKLLMLSRAVELHGCMQAGGDVPLFCWLLFARDSSDCPRSFLSNHLSHVGLSAGLEQVEMFLLGYALQCTIQVYRLYKADTEEFVTYYPDDHKDDWPAVCLVTEDDRHYNVPVVEVSELQKELDSS
ncbi:flocculation protein FLO11-like [Cheilinus undulatus]|uniref:flocculation protein FLO11-like n=1 Tax=Cheilinus undulatus TaxID=241271 RepID=UPI001BD22EE0|nr:flocculation protein FLO11-like [Cheilinus undulatus]XP_041670169.1 flocculation protein FLO11-like [Cheilinus undulatus]